MTSFPSFNFKRSGDTPDTYYTKKTYNDIYEINISIPRDDSYDEIVIDQAVRNIIKRFEENLYFAIKFTMIPRRLDNLLIQYHTNDKGRLVIRVTEELPKDTVFIEDSDAKYKAFVTGLGGFIN